MSKKYKLLPLEFKSVTLKLMRWSFLEQAFGQNTKRKHLVNLLGILLSL